MKKFFVLASISLGLTLFTMTPAFANWAAIAYCRNTGYFGEGYHPYSSAASRYALADCTGYGKRCVVEMLFEDQCGALARKRDDISIIAAGYSKNGRDEAGNNALAACGSDCELVTTICSE